MQQIERGIYYEDSFLGVTVGALVFSHGAILIDAPLRLEDNRSWRSTITNQRGGPNRLLVSLDAHPDRTLGTRALECTIITHHKTAQVFRNRPTIFKGQSVETGAVWETYSEAIGMRWASPDITFTERMSLHWGGAEVILEHHPGPSAGAIWVLVPDYHTMFVGDTVVARQPSFFAQADFDAWLASLDLLLSEYSNYTVVSGRSGRVTVGDIQAEKELILEVLEKFDALAKRGASPEATYDMVPSLLSNIKAPAEMQDLYTRRLKYGLSHSYARRYRPGSALDRPEAEDEE